MKNFELLPYKLAKSAFLYGYKRPTKVYEEAIPVIQARRSLLLYSPTGSGKTAAFVIGTYLAVYPSSPVLYALVVSPTRELCYQTYAVFATLTDLKTALILTQIDYFNFFKSGSYVVITTIERFSKLFQPKTVKLVVFDEVDQMLSEKPELLQKIALACYEKQCVLCSATFSAYNLELLKYLFKLHSEVRIAAEQSASSNKHYLHCCAAGAEEKKVILSSILQTFVFNQCAIFCNRRAAVETTSAHLRSQKFAAEALHSGMTYSERLQAMRRFANGECRILVCTDVFGRGMDIRQINLVVNYDVPADIEAFEHRSGRGGRFGRAGIVVTIASDAEGEQVQNWWGTLGFNGEVI